MELRDNTEKSSVRVEVIFILNYQDRIIKKEMCTNGQACFSRLNIYRPGYRNYRSQVLKYTWNVFEMLQIKQVLTKSNYSNRVHSQTMMQLRQKIRILKNVSRKYLGPSLLSDAVIKHYDQKQLGEEWVSLAYAYLESTERR